MMVPADGKYFFASDVFRGLGAKPTLPMDGDDPDPAPGQSH
jgi:hypothetical protein